jgi:hypothetical protein
VLAEQAIFTSLSRRGKAGYHLVARSPGVTNGEANALTTWSPSHGALIIDDSNRYSVNFHPLPSGRFALSRTCEGLPEYSGRGGRQLYTHTLIIDEKKLRQTSNHPFSIFRDALALGYYRFRAEPQPVIPPVPLSRVYPALDDACWAKRVEALGVSSVASLLEKLTSQKPFELAFPGDRTLLAECLIGLVPPESRPNVSFATSLRPSMVRPYKIVLVSSPG